MNAEEIKLSNESSINSAVNSFLWKVPVAEHYGAHFFGCGENFVEFSNSLSFLKPDTVSASDE